jgi:hypothetical protein
MPDTAQLGSANRRAARITSSTIPGPGRYNNRSHVIPRATPANKEVR